MRAFFSFVLLLALTGCTTADKALITQDFGMVDAEAKRLMEREGVVGMALAVIKDGQVAHVAA